MIASWLWALLLRLARIHISILNRPEGNNALFVHLQDKLVSLAPKAHKKKLKEKRPTVKCRIRTSKEDKCRGNLTRLSGASNRGSWAPVAHLFGRSSINLNGRVNGTRTNESVSTTRNMRQRVLYLRNSIDTDSLWDQLHRKWSSKAYNGSFRRGIVYHAAGASESHDRRSVDDTDWLH